MKKLLFVACIMGMLALMACSFHSKQPKDDTYYKRTQSVEWPS